MERISNETQFNQNIGEDVERGIRGERVRMMWFFLFVVVLFVWGLGFFFFHYQFTFRQLVKSGALTNMNSILVACVYQSFFFVTAETLKPQPSLESGGSY